MRGKHPEIYLLFDLPGITPAGAGKTAHDALYHAGCEDHPRRCGENIRWSHPERLRDGSPPQVRGKQDQTRSSVFASRITPAGAGKTYTLINCGFASEDHPRRCGENSIQLCCMGIQLWITPAGAGKTNWLTGISILNQDHPRRCGENRLCDRLSGAAGGSPPQVRGKRVPTGAAMPLPRITPAGAGKTQFRQCVFSSCQDHPRRCGENGQTASIQQA